MAKLVTVFGASGFVGTQATQALARAGWRVRAAVRRPNEAGYLRPLGAVGQVTPIQANIRDERSTAAAIEGADAVVNLVGILYETGRQRFDAVQHLGAERVARLAAQAGVGRLVQMSAIGADPEAESDYARTKGLGEAGAREAFPGATILRPSIVFGPEDDFFNRFAAMTRFTPCLPLIGGGETRFQPVYVGDVAAAVEAALTRGGAAGATYELGGPQVYTFKELMELMLREIRRKRLLVPLPFAIARFKARILELAPKPLLTVDQVRLLEHDNVVAEDALTLADLGIQPTAAEAVLASYLWRFRPHGQFERPAAA